MFPIIAFLAFRAQDIIPFFFGEKSKNIISPFQVIIWSGIFIYYNYFLIRIALFINRTRIVFSSLAIEALAAVVLNLYLIPRYGLAGVCIATVASVIIMFGFTVFYITRAGIKIPFYKSCEKPIAATMGLILILHYVDSWPFMLILLLGFTGYSLMLIITSLLDKEGF